MNILFDHARGLPTSAMFSARAEAGLLHDAASPPLALILRPRSPQARAATSKPLYRTRQETPASPLDPARRRVPIKR